jgi:threonine synthase
MTDRPQLVERYREFLPVSDTTPSLSLGEGFTPWYGWGASAKSLAW